MLDMGCETLLSGVIMNDSSLKFDIISNLTSQISNLKNGNYNR